MSRHEVLLLVQGTWVTLAALWIRASRRRDRGAKYTVATTRKEPTS